MTIQLIMLDTPIIVSDELRKIGDFYRGEGFAGPNTFKWQESQELHYPNQKGKIIAGLPELLQIDWNGLEEEFGFIDVEKLAMDKLRNKWPHLYQFGYPQKPFPTNYESDLNLVKVSIYEAQQLNDKKFSMEDMGAAVAFGFDVCKKEKRAPFTKEFFDFIMSISQPKVFDIEVEMEEDYEDHPELVGNPREMWSYPKITNNKIKITKKL